MHPPMRCAPVGPLPDVLDPDEVALLFDAECVVCSRWVHFVLRWDRRGTLRLGAVQSQAGRRLLTYAGLDPDDLDTMLLVERGVPYARSTAFLRAVRYFRFPMRALAVGLLLPSGLRDWLYDRFAARRYRLFGKQALCLVPAPEHRARFLPDDAG
jgi:predicted DCC family thiol-disulfide oxidoreductase YuxK